MKGLFKVFIILFLIVVYTYVIVIQAIPDNVVIFEGEGLNLNTILGIKANIIENNKVVETLSNNQEDTIDNKGHRTIKLSLFDNIFLKDINVDVIERATVIPVRKFSWFKIIY